MFNDNVNDNNVDERKRVSKLPDEVVAKIAAGEVVINPASVVKELIENSLDAQANYVEIHIRNGGKSYIKVADNGMGMSKEDLLLSIERYTTSKITQLEDIYNIQSYGFRGEALASIAEVSRLIITTSQGENFESHNFENNIEKNKKDKKIEDSIFKDLQEKQRVHQIAYRLEVIGGKIVKITETYRERGTTVEVYDLFFNIPARRKFLSSDKIEARMVTEIVEKFILSRPDVHFILKVDEKLIYNAKPGDLEDRFRIIFPEVREFRRINTLENLAELGERKDNIITEFFKVSGIISSPQYTRRNRTGQIFFVNKRFVVDSLLNLSLERGYGEALIQGEHPYAVIFLDFQPDKIDVNIHPQKLQVKFSNPQYVYNNLAIIVRENVRKFSQYSLHIEKFSNSSTQSTQTAQPNQSNEQISSIQLDLGRTNEIIGKFDYQKKLESMNQVGNMGDIDQNLNSAFLFQSLKNIRIKDFLIVKNRYIIFEDIDGLAIIDFHAAHERIIYERLKEKNYEAVSLIIPIRIKLTRSLIQLAEQLFEEFKELGFSYVVKQFEDGSGEIEIRQIPSILKIVDAAEVFLESLEEYRIPFDKPETLKQVLATKACKAAIKTNDRLSDDEVHQLIIEIKDKQLLTCPHGRPILMKMSFTQIDSYFERI